MAHHLRKPKAEPRPPLTVVWRRIEVLRPDPASPRSHSPTQIRALARSITIFGFNVPILVDPTMRIIAGHGRLLAARELGWREVPTILLAHLSEAKARAFMIADNRVAEGAGWNTGLLLAQLTELSLVEPDLAIEATGFEQEGIDLQLASSPSSARKRSRRSALVTVPPRPPPAPVSKAEEASDADEGERPFPQSEATVAPPALMPAGARG